MRNNELTDRLSKLVISDEMADEVLSFVDASGRLDFGPLGCGGVGSDQVWAVDLIRAVLNAVSRGKTQPNPLIAALVMRSLASKLIISDQIPFAITNLCLFLDCLTTWDTNKSCTACSTLDHAIKQLPIARKSVLV